MAKKIRFPLQMNGTDVRTIEELREHFDLESVLGYFANGKLVIWLRNRYYDKEADDVEELSAKDDNLAEMLCDILDVSFSHAKDDVNIVSIKRRQEKIALLRQGIYDENLVSKVDAVAFNQEDLHDILINKKEKTIYLCNGEFEINLMKEKINYIGIDNPVVLLVQNKSEKIDSLNIEFTNIFNIETSGLYR